MKRFLKVTGLLIAGLALGVKGTQYSVKKGTMVVDDDGNLVNAENWFDIARNKKEAGQ